MNRIILAGKNSDFPQITRGLHLPGRGNSARSADPTFVGRAVSYDATAERWIVPPSGKKPDAGPAAELRDPRLQNTQTVPTPETNSPVSSPEDTGRLLRAMVESFTVLAGLAVFSAIAWFFLVLS